MREVRIGKNDAGQRLDKFLTKSLPTLPPSLLYKSIRLKKIKVNRKRATPEQMLVEGDTLQLFLSEEFFGAREEATRASRLAAIRPNLSILYEDSEILLVNKRAGLSVHEDEGGSSATLIDQIQAYLYQRGEYDPESEQSFAPALCNRIDRNTQGIVIAAKTAEALRVMDEKIRLRETHKFYLTVVHGTPRQRAATLTAYLKRDVGKSLVRIYDTPREGAKEIRTRYRTLATNGDLSLLEVELLTGRTHQIRAHLAHIGHPILGEGKYGVNRTDRARGYRHQALCSYRLTFDFTTPSGCLSHLSGKTFEIPPREIDFVADLFGGVFS